MEYTDKEYCLEVWGDIACFTRPELKVERVSYDVITPSAARAIFEAIYWKPAIRWEITRIEVINPIRRTSVRRNEVGAVAVKKPIFIEEKRQQKNTLMLKDVRYRIYARMVFIPVRCREGGTRLPGADENPGKYNAIFERRAALGQCFSQPYLGTRECAAFFELIENDSQKTEAPIAESRDFAIMLYDLDFSNPNDIRPMFYHANMENGVITVPSPDSPLILR